MAAAVETIDVVANAGAAQVRGVNRPSRQRWYQRVARDRTSLVCLSIVAVVVGLAVFGPSLPIQDPNEMHLTDQLAKPSSAHWLGTDSFGRDILSRIVYGARISILVGTVSVGLAVALGATSGVVAGYVGGFGDSVLMRVMDALLAFPAILLAIVLVGVLGPGELNVMLALGVVFAPSFARIARSKTMTVRQQEFVTAATAMGASHSRILGRHIVPNCLGPVVVQATVAFAFAIIAEAGLSFLGLGVPPEVPSWGAMLTEARKFIQTDAWFAFIPGLALSITVLSITLLGDRVREIVDPAS